MKPLRCFECCGGHYQIELRAYVTTNSKGELLVVPSIPHHVCDKCGDVILSGEACRMIEEARQKTGVVYRRPKFDRNAPSSPNPLS